MDTKQAVETLVKALNTDPGYRYTWEANIAMSFKDMWHARLKENSDCIDHEMLNDISGAAARYFLNILCRDTDNEDDLPGMLAVSIELQKAQ